MSEPQVTERDREEAKRIAVGIPPRWGIAQDIALALADQRELIAAWADGHGFAGIAAAIRKGEAA